MQGFNQNTMGGMFPSTIFPMPLLDFHNPENPFNYMPDLYVKKKYKNIPDAPKFYFKKSHIPFVD